MDRFGIRTVVLISLSLCILGTLLLASTSNYSLLILSRILVGTGSTAGFLCTAKLGVELFGAGQASFMLGLTLAMGTLGAFVGGIPLMTLSHWTGNWRTALMAICGLGTALWILNAGLLPQSLARSEVRLPLSLHNLKSLVTKSYLGFCLKACAIYLPICIFADTWEIPFLIRAGVSAKAAAGLTTCIYVGIALGSPLLPFINKVSRNRLILSCICLSGISLAVVQYLAGHFHAFHPTLFFAMASVLLILTGFFAGAEMLCFSEGIKNIPIASVGFLTSFMNCVIMATGSAGQFAIGYFLDTFAKTSPLTSGLENYDFQTFQKFVFLSLIASITLGLLPDLFTKKPLQTAAAAAAAPK